MSYKAPDKIYLNKYMFRRGMMYPARDADTPDIEYIRKEALLEWSENKKKELLEMEITDVSAGMNGAFDLLVNKLKSM